MPRTADLLGVAHVLCQSAQCWKFGMTFMELNTACASRGVSAYSLDLIAGTCGTPELAGLPDAAGLPVWLRSELAAHMTPRGFAFEELSVAVVEISVLPDGDGSMFGIRTRLVRNGRVIERALDPVGRIADERG